LQHFRLKANGLSVLLLEDHSAPVVTFGVTYDVGSGNDPAGASGEAHLLEHMMFKGTPRFNERRGNSYDAMLARIGASANAETDYDCTHYYATVPREYLDLITELEADRMRALSLRDEDRKHESAVVRDEYERAECSIPKTSRACHPSLQPCWIREPRKGIKLLSPMHWSH
jgi:zinc protease